MYEVTELINTHQFSQRIIPVILRNAESIFNLKKRKQYYNYWGRQLSNVKILHGDLDNEDSLQELKKLSDIVSRLDIFFTNLLELKLLKFDAVVKDDYRPIEKFILPNARKSVNRFYDYKSIILEYYNCLEIANIKFPYIPLITAGDKANHEYIKDQIKVSLNDFQYKIPEDLMNNFYSKTSNY